MDVDLAYGEYIQSFAELILEKKNLKSTESSLSKSINGIFKEVKSLQIMSKLIRTKMKDTKNLSNLNIYMDAFHSQMENLESE